MGAGAAGGPGARRLEALLELEALRGGAVMKRAVGEEGPAGERPAAGDLVRVAVHSCSGSGGRDLLARAGGEAVVHFVVEGKVPAARAPRGWELAVTNMAPGERAEFSLRAPLGAPPGEDDGAATPPAGGLFGRPDWGEDVELDLTLLSVTPALFVRELDEAGRWIKAVECEGGAWETPRPPYRVKLSCEVRDPAGSVRFCSPDGHPWDVTMGAGQLPEAVEAGVASMVEGERARLVCPAGALEAAVGPAALLPAVEWGPDWSPGDQVEVHLHLVRLFQVRDVLGDGALLKTRLRDGTGQFPVDCPIEDCRVRLHYSARLPGSSGPAAFDTAERSDGGGERPPPLEVTLGTGALPQALEWCVKLMVPGESARVEARPPHGYSDGDASRPAGVPEGSPVEWEVELFDFDRPTSAEDMSAAEVLAAAGALKSEGNELFQSARLPLAEARYGMALRLLDRGGFALEAEADVAAAEAVKTACHLNLAACAQKQGRFGDALRESEAALKTGPGLPKALLRRAQALTSLNEFARAAEDYEALAHAGPEWAGEAAAGGERLRRCAQRAAQQERRQFQGFLRRGADAP